MITVEFKRQTGIDMASGEEVTLDQEIVVVDGREVAYLSETPATAPNLMFFTEVSEAELAVVEEKCQTHKGGVRCRTVGVPPAIPEEFLADEDDDEDEDA